MSGQPLGSNNVHICGSWGTDVNLRCRSGYVNMLHYDVVFQVLCIIRPEQLSHMYHKSHFHESSVIGTSKHAPKMRISYDHTSSQHIW